MIPKLVRTITGGLGLATMMIFIIGLAHSISTGFAGFWGGLPFAIIALIVLSMASYDFWDECLRKKRDE